MNQRPETDPAALTDVSISIHHASELASAWAGVAARKSSGGSSHGDETDSKILIERALPDKEDGRLGMQ